MSKGSPTKLKPPPWIPPGKNALRARKSQRPQLRSKVRSSTDTSPKRVVPIPTYEKEDEKEDDPVDLMSLSSSSSSSHSRHDVPNIHLQSMYREIKLFNEHFASLNTSYLSAHRLIELQNIDDVSINEMLKEAGFCVTELNGSFDDLEFSVSILENTLDEGSKTQEYLKVYRYKEILLSKLLDMYEKVLIVYQSVFQKQDFQEISQLQDSLSRKLKMNEKKNISQEAIITDLERRLSIYQSKITAMESYKTNLENARADLEKQLLHKESQIKYLSDELMNVSSKTMKSGHEDLIEIIEGIKSKAHSEKSVLKKAVKFQKTQLKEHEKKFQKITEELKEKENMVFDIASQRDQLKVQLTVVNNNVIQLKNQIEEVKIQNLKLQNEMDEQKLLSKKEVKELQSDLEEKAALLEKTLKMKKNLEGTIEGLETELETSKTQLKSLNREIGASKSADSPKHRNSDAVIEEIRRLTTLLQSTKDVFESLKVSPHTMSGDHLANGGTEWLSAQNEILEAVKETKKHLLELKDMYRGVHSEQKGNHSLGKKSDLEKQFRKLEQLYNSSMKENQALKSEIDELKNTSATNSTVQKTENYFTANIPRDSLSRKQELELIHKNGEILKMKYDFQQKERDLENQLRDYKDKVKTLEIDHLRISNLEEDLKANKVELSVLQQKKEEETNRLVQHTKELQDSLDLKNAENESLNRYVQLLKSSYFNVFGGS